jgi:hypothetical protein
MTLRQGRDGPQCCRVFFEGYEAAELQFNKTVIPGELIEVMRDPESSKLSENQIILDPGLPR